MDITDINLIYEHIICKCHNCNRGDIDEADAIIMDNLYGVFCDCLNKTNSPKEMEYRKRCQEMAGFLIVALEKTSLSNTQKHRIKTQLKNPNYFTVLFVLGELEALFNL